MINCPETFTTFVDIREKKQINFEYTMYFSDVAKSVIVRDGNKAITNYMFTRCPNLSECTIPASVTYIDPKAFADKNKITIRGYSGSYAEKYAKKNKIKFVPIGTTINQNKVYKVGAYNYKFNLSNNTATLVSSASKNIKKVTVPNKVTYAGKTFTVTNIAKNAFKNCTKLTKASNNANAIISISRHAGDYTSQLGFSSNGNLYYREGVGATAWKTILTSSNYTSYTVTKTGGGASGTWGINITGSAGSVAWGNVSGKPSSYTPSSHTHDDRYYTETEINTKLGAKLGAVSANGYYGMTRPDGNTSDWIRTTTAGIIPYQSGGAGGGHCGIGTSSWYFSNAYIDTVNCVNTNASGLISTSSEYRSCKGGEVNRDWRFGSATGSGDQNWFGFYDYTYGYHGGIYGPGHSLRMGGEIQSTAANGFRAVQGKYGFIIRNDGSNVYFMMTGNGDPWGGWNDNYTIFTPNGEWQVKKSPYDNGMSTARGYVVVSDSNDNRVYSISNYNANYLKVRCGLNTYHCTYSNSDIRLKKNINNTSITNALSVINSIKVRQFDWKETNIHQSIGFVADELEKLDPNFSQGGGVTKDGGIDVKSVNSFYLQGYIVKALQELSSQVSDLKQENKRLKQKLNMCN